MTKQNRNVVVRNTLPAFFADGIAVMHNPAKVILDFRQTSPRLDLIGNDQQQTIVVSHNTIHLDPITAKILSTILTENLKQYEARHGELKIPERKKQTKDDNTVSYIG